LLERLPEPSVARRHACQPPSWTARGMPCPLSDAGCTLRPTHRFSVSRSSVTPLGHPSTAQSGQVVVPPAGVEPAASGLRARRHRRFDHGGAKLRRQDSNLPFAINSRASYRLDYAGTSGGSRTRTYEAGTALRLSTAPPCQLGHASAERKERESNPQGPKAHPFSRRDTAPVAVLPEVAPAGIEPAPPG
jgi:hypothetical protein